MNPLEALEPVIVPGVPEQRPSRRAALARRCWQVAIVLLVVGWALTLLAIWGDQRAAAAAAWHNPADGVQPEAIALDLALLSLAGVPDDQVLALSMDLGELETTRALLALSADLTDQRRMGGWLWLAFRFQEAGQTGRAAQAYRLAGTGAIVSMVLPDLLRTETLLAAGRQLIGLHDEAGALFFLRQAALVGASAPGLTAYHRRSVLERLVPAAARVGGRRNDWVALAKKVKEDLDGSEGATAPGPPRQMGWNNYVPEKDSALAGAQSARRTAAAAWLEILSAAYDSTEAGRGAAEWPGFEEGEKARQILRQALLTEDAAVEEYAAQREGSEQARLVAQETRLRWLLLKRRVAVGGAGLVPEWESKREEIDVELSAAWAGWLALQTDGESPDGEPLYSARPARWAVTAAYWGLYPEAPVTDLMPGAQVASGFGSLRLTTLKPGNLPVVGWSDKKH